MSTYRLFFTTTASTSVEVEADSYEEAFEAAWQKLPGGVCHQCASDYDLSGDFDCDESAHVKDGQFISEVTA